jgi:hypothetical protein
MKQTFVNEITSQVVRTRLPLEKPWRLIKDSRGLCPTKALLARVEALQGSVRPPQNAFGSALLAGSFS